MTTVAFVSYTFQEAKRRVGPVEKEAAYTLAKEYARRSDVSEVVVEEWTCTRVSTISSFPGPA